MNQDTFLGMTALWQSLAFRNGTQQAALSLEAGIDIVLVHNCTLLFFIMKLVSKPILGTSAKPRTITGEATK
ncbi:MAG: hypothetical protein RPS47_17510 [Colwellia sp.]